MIYQCESCNNGYALTLSACPHCGAGDWAAHQIAPPVRMCDTECYKNYWLCQFDNPPQSFELFPGHPLDVNGLLNALTTCTSVGFNSNNYDIPIISAALTGVDNQGLKDINDAIILQGVKHWQLPIESRVFDHIDLIEVAPGQDGLKMYGGKMHAPKLQDLPIDPSASIDWPDRVLLREYCGNDLATTRLLYDAMSAQIKLREEMSAQYGVDLRSKSDAQIAEAVMKTALSFKIDRPQIAPGAQFYYRPPAWMQFVTLDVLALLERNPFKITDSGGIEMSSELARTHIKIGSSTYRMGSGGLHSSEQAAIHVADETYRLSDHDVASYYPSILRRLGVYPPQIGGAFQTIYGGWYETRMEAKRAGDKKKANTYKTLLNGVGGKLNSRWSIFYAPSELIQMTMTGQLALLMLIERLELCGMSVVSANTDGIVIKSRRNTEWLRDECIAWWEAVTGFVMEATEYKATYARDVNSYVAITTDGQIKTKGAYAPPVPGASGWPNPTTQVCVDAVIAYLTHGTPLAATIHGCRDPRQFVSIRKVKGGGQWREQYLGKAVRWYYATEDADCIRYVTNGNKVAKTDGCRPCMELPSELPADIDYAWYVAEARGLLADLGARI